MPRTVTRTIPSEKTPEPSCVPDRPERRPTPQSGRSILFFVADFVFLVLAGIAATLTMHMVHQLQWPFALTCLVGMIAAMVVQTLMAFAIAPLLGSIESMVPSMIVGMTSPMTICVLHLFDCESTLALAAAVGTAFGTGVFIFVQVYGRTCRNALMTHCALGGS